MPHHKWLYQVSVSQTRCQVKRLKKVNYPTYQGETSFCRQYKFIDSFLLPILHQSILTLEYTNFELHCVGIMNFIGVTEVYLIWTSGASMCCIWPLEWHWPLVSLRTNSSFQKLCTNKNIELLVLQSIVKQANRSQLKLTYGF